MEVNVIVLHTTEGASLPTYSGGAVAPNFTAVPDFTKQTLTWYQHFDFDTSSRALVNLSGGVETNTLNVCQIELVGTCDPATHKKWGSTKHIYWPEAPDWALKELASFLAWANKNHNVPLTAVSKWVAYPASYGSSGGQRMSNSEWNKFSGICGHQHVPENVHGDPGALDVVTILKYAKADVAPTTPVVTTPTPAKPVDVTVSLKNLKFAKKNNDVKQVQSALIKKGYKISKATGFYGLQTRAAYKKWQKHLGYSGTGADGIPGKASLEKLGFKVTA